MHCNVSKQVKLLNTEIELDFKRWKVEDKKKKCIELKKKT